jgi:hypothetical protein
MEVAKILMILLLVCYFRESEFLEPARQKQLSVFTVVAFPNEQCQVVSDKVTKGTCMTSTECTDFAGTKDGNCAGGFGVCCLIGLKACGGDVTKNRTYVMNPDYPTVYTSTSKTCKYTVSPDVTDGSGICQLRLDFTTLILNTPPSSGACSDGFTISSPSLGMEFGTICGQYLSGHHVFIETGDSSPAATFTVSTDSNSGDRSWKIKVDQIAGEATYRAPTDCVQYHTGLSGTFMSFNHPNYIPQGQHYAICIRQEEGHCSIAYSTNPIGSNEDFRLHPKALSTTITTSKRSTSCARAQLQIRTNPVQSDVYCGRSFNSNSGDEADGVVYTHSLPFQIFVSTFTGKDQLGANGFSLKYHQLPCGERESASKYS